MSQMKLIFNFLVISSVAFATGFERNLMWSGKWAALGGASNAAVGGAEAVAFNPAGIGKGQGGFSLNLSPILSASEGPTLPQTPADGVPGRVADGESVFDPGFAVLFGKKMNEKLGIGFGVYQQGSLNTEYASVNASDVAGFTGSYNGSVGADFNFTEVAAGASYEINESWSIGAAVRMGIARGELDQYIIIDNNNADNYQLSGLQDETFGGYRIGLQYDSSDKMWGMGFTYRSAMEFEMEGTSGGGLIKTGTFANFNGGAATVTTELPEQFSAGLYFKSSEMDTVFLEGNYTKYSNLDRLRMTGSYDLGAKSLNNGIILNWDDMINLRIGFEHNTGSMQYRFGYAFGSQVTGDASANAAFAPPGITHSIAGGVGMQINKRLGLDIAGEYTFSSGTGSTDNTGTVIGANNGEFTTTQLGAHATLRFAF